MLYNQVRRLDERGCIIVLSVWTKIRVARRIRQAMGDPAVKDFAVKGETSTSERFWYYPCGSLPLLPASQVA